MYLKRIFTYSILSIIALGGFFGNIHIETQKSGIEIASISYEGNGVYAATCTAGQTPAANGCEAPPSTSSLTMYNNLIDTLNIILAVLSALISPIILFVGWLMSPDWTSGDIFGLRTPMYSLWVTVSNIVYFVYAILLILIALGTMFGKESFSYKVMLPKLALGILMVPFTWWFVQWTISVASVVTASVMTIPAETISKGDSAWFNTSSIPKNITVSNIGTGSTEYKADCAVNPDVCVSPKQFLEKAGGIYGPLVVYGYSIFKFQKIDTLGSAIDVASAAIKIVHTTIVSAIMFLVFGLLVLALATMLIVRAIKLWVYAIFSPLFTFQFVAGGAMKSVDSDGTFTISEFVGLCFVPAIVGLSLSFGLIMINAVQGSTQTTSGASSVQTCDLTSDAGCTILNIMGSPDNKITRWLKTDPDNSDNQSNKWTETRFDYGGLKFSFLGKATNQSTTTTTAIGALDAVGGMFGTLIIDIIALVFIWMAFMAAKNVSKAVKMAVEPFEKIGQQVGSLAKSIPKYTPIPGLGMSMSGVEKGIGKVKQGYEDHRANEDAKSPIGRLLGLEAAARKETVKAIENIKSSNSTTLSPEVVGNLRTQLSQETKGNKAEKTAEGLNAILEKYANKDKDGKFTGWKDENYLISNMKAMGIKDDDLLKIKTSYVKGPITKNYLENNPDGSRIYKKIHPNVAAEENPKTNTTESNSTGGKPTTPDPAAPNSPTSH